MKEESTRHPTVTEGDAVSELSDETCEAARVLFGAGDPIGTSKQLLKLSVDTIEGCDFAGVLLINGAEIAVGVASHPPAVEVDSFQRASGEGPGIDAMADLVKVHSDELSHEVRWPAFRAVASAAGVHSVLAFPIGTDGTLNLYSRHPGAFDTVGRAKGAILASLAGYALSAARALGEAIRRADNLDKGLKGREIIGQAEGILMERERITAGQAFDVLRRASQHLNVKLHVVAQNLVETGERPEFA